MFHVTSTALHLFGLTIHWYGLIIAIGIVLAVILAAIREKRLGLPRETTLDLALICTPAAVIAARLNYVMGPGMLLSGHDNTGLSGAALAAAETGNSTAGLYGGDVYYGKNNR